MAIRTGRRNLSSRHISAANSAIGPVDIVLARASRHARRMYPISPISPIKATPMVQIAKSSNGQRMAIQCVIAVVIEVVRAVGAAANMPLCVPAIALTCGVTGAGKAGRGSGMAL